MRTATKRCQARRWFVTRVRIDCKSPAGRYKHGLRGRGPDEGLKERRRMADDRNCAAFSVRGQDFALVGGGQQIAGRHVLRGQNPIHRLQRELPAIVQEIREMGLPKAGLARQQRDADRASLYPAQQFQAEPLMHLGKVHLWKIRHQQWERTVPIFFLQIWKSRVAFIVGA